MDNTAMLQEILEKLKGIDRLEANQKQMQADISGLKSDVSSLKSDVSSLKEDISELKEDTSVTRSATNTLLEWAEKVQVQTQIPLLQKREG